MSQQHSGGEALSIRIGAAEDYAAIGELNREGGFNFASESEILKVSDERVDPSFIVVAEHEGRMVAKMDLMEVENARRGRFLLLSRLMVHPDYRRRGIARHMMEYAVEEARRRGLAALDLFVSIDNQSAYELYLKMGFQELDRDVHLSLPIE